MLSAIAFVNTKTTICSAHSLGQAQYLPFYGGRCLAQASAAEQFGSEGGGLLRERGRKIRFRPVSVPAGPPRIRLRGAAASSDVSLSFLQGPAHP